MLARTFRTKRFGLTIEVPDGIGRAARRVLRRGRAARAGRLLLAPAGRELRIDRRDPGGTVEGFRERNPVTPDAKPPHLNGNGTDLASRAASLRWYHTIELGGGLSTPGIFDHREVVPHYGIPEDLSGKRVLDVATFDGFWAFEFERRGAREVVALDLERLSQVDFPPQVRAAMRAQGLDQRLGAGFDLARAALGSRVVRKIGSVYDLDSAEIGAFDLVHVADLLLHLERPLEALRRVRSVTRGEAMIVDSIDPRLDDPEGRHLIRYLGGWWDVTWWLPSLDSLAQMVLDAGFADVRLHTLYNLAQVGGTEGHWRAVLFATP